MKYDESTGTKNKLPEQPATKVNIQIFMNIVLKTDSKTSRTASLRFVKLRNLKIISHVFSSVCGFCLKKHYVCAFKKMSILTHINLIVIHIIDEIQY